TQSAAQILKFLNIQKQPFTWRHFQSPQMCRACFGCQVFNIGTLRTRVFNKIVTAAIEKALLPMYNTSATAPDFLYQTEKEAVAHLKTSYYRCIFSANSLFFAIIL
ncbi:MAG: hypothetical protein RR825_06820, partial [Ruthenibacterium sp.]